MQFEWDENKARRNEIKHHIRFEDAVLIFEDPFRIEAVDKQHSRECEMRYKTIGFVDDVLFVVYTERRERIRIISARLATPRERRAYYDGNL